LVNSQILNYHKYTLILKKHTGAICQISARSEFL